MSEPTFKIGSNELCFLGKDDQILREKCLYLERSGIGCKEFQRGHPKPFLKKFHLFEDIFEDIV